MGTSSERIPARSVVEAASWSLAAALCRASPELVTRRHHPGGGQYDCLGLSSQRGASIDLNREGRIHLHAAEGGTSVPNWEAAPWSDYLEDPHAFVQRLQERARLTAPSTLPPTTARVLAYRVIAAVARLHAFSTPITIEMDSVDSSGPAGGGTATWVSGFPEVLKAVQDGPYSFWRVATKKLELVLETERAVMHSRDGKTTSLTQAYDDVGRRFDRLMGRLLAG